MVLPLLETLAMKSTIRVLLKLVALRHKSWEANGLSCGCDRFPANRTDGFSGDELCHVVLLKRKTGKAASEEFVDVGVPLTKRAKHFKVSRRWTSCRRVSMEDHSIHVVTKLNTPRTTTYDQTRPVFERSHCVLQPPDSYVACPNSRTKSSTCMPRAILRTVDAGRISPLIPDATFIAPRGGDPW
jgi:hypothetical protein